jgi:hypothetical protein
MSHSALAPVAASFAAGVVEAGVVEAGVVEAGVVVAGAAGEPVEAGLADTELHFLSQTRTGNPLLSEGQISQILPSRG